MTDTNIALPDGRDRLRELEAEIAEAREACPVVRRQDFFDAPLKVLIDHEIGQLFQMQSRAEQAEAEITRLSQRVERERSLYENAQCVTCEKDLAALCQWTYDEHDDKWDTTCDNAQQFITDGPQENGYRHCPYCGGQLVLSPAGSTQP